MSTGGGPVFWLVYWGLMLSALGGSIGSEFSALAAAITVGLAAIIIVRIIFPGRWSTHTLTVIVLFMTVVVGFLHWRILSTTEDTIKTDQRPWVGMMGIDPVREHPQSDKIIAYGVTIGKAASRPPWKWIFK